MPGSDMGELEGAVDALQVGSIASPLCNRLSSPLCSLLWMPCRWGPSLAPYIGAYSHIAPITLSNPYLIHIQPISYTSKYIYDPYVTPI